MRSIGVRSSEMGAEAKSKESDRDLTGAAIADDDELEARVVHGLLIGECLQRGEGSG